MPTSGSGTVAPTSGGAGVGLDIAQPLPYTLLALHRYAKIMGINPVHFSMGTANNLTPGVWPVNTCGGVWPRHAWQNYDQVSQEDIAFAIRDAEADLARAVGYWAAPTWITAEDHPFPRDFYRTSLYQVYDVRGFNKSINVRWRRIVERGTRAVTLLGTPTVAGGTLAYTDEDSDGFFETATVTVNAVTATTEACKIKVFFYGKAGAMEWEIRPAKSKTLAAGVFTAVFPSWLFIDPDLQSVYPTENGFSAIDISTIANFVTSVQVYYEYTDTTDASCQFLWEPTVVGGFCSCCSGSGCSACIDTTQDGCAHIRDPHLGVMVPTPATYTAGTGWGAASFSVCRAPDKVKFWYYAGERSEEFLAGRDCDPLSDYWAQTIAMLATARLIKPACACAHVRERFAYWQTDLSKTEGNTSYFAGRDVSDNAFLGQTRGEVMAWRRVRHLMGLRVGGYTV